MRLGQPLPFISLSLARFLGTLICACTLTGGCASPSRQQVLIHESLQGAVYLESAPDPSFQATHPISLSPTILFRVLSGIHVQDNQRLLQTLVAGRPKPLPVFSDEDMEFLAPLLVKALSHATPTQQVGFYVRHPVEVGQETTGGTLYAEGRSLHVTLTRYRYNPDKLDTHSKPHRQLPTTTGLEQREALFIPETALRPAMFQQSPLHRTSHLTTFVIDYALLAELPSSDLTPSAFSTFPPEQTPHVKPEHRAPSQTTRDAPTSRERKDVDSEEVRRLKNLLIKKDLELEALKEELQAVRRRLANRETESQSPQRKQQPALRQPGTVP